jgi:hypothetical protein
MQICRSRASASVHAVGRGARLPATSAGARLGRGWGEGRGAKLSPNGDAIERRRGQARSWAGAGPISGWVAPTPAPTPTRWPRSRGRVFQPQIDPRPPAVLSLCVRRLGRGVPSCARAKPWWGAATHLDGTSRRSSVCNRGRRARGVGHEHRQSRHGGARIVSGVDELVGGVN